MARLPLLAQVTDVEARIGRAVVDTERVQVETMLRDASAVVRNYTRRDFTPVVDDVIVLRPTGNTVRLPQRPVNAVTAVSVVAPELAPTGAISDRIPLPIWYFDGIDELWIYGGPANVQIINLPEALYDLWRNRTPLVEVTYSHGELETPDDVVGVVAGMVVRTQTTPGRGNVSSESAGDYSYSVSFQVQLGPLGLSDTDRMILNAYKQKMHTIELRGG